MANPNGRKGAQFETDVMKWLRSMGAVAERLTKAGAKDEGDLVTIIAGKTYILELKNRKKIDLPAFWDEAPPPNPPRISFFVGCLHAAADIFVII